MDCRLEDCVRCTCINSHALDVYFHIWRWDIFTPGEDGSYDTSLRFKIRGIIGKRHGVYLQHGVKTLKYQNKLQLHRHWLQKQQ